MFCMLGDILALRWLSYSVAGRGVVKENTQNKMEFPRLEKHQGHPKQQGREDEGKYRGAANASWQNGVWSPSFMLGHLLRKRQKKTRKSKVQESYQSSVTPVFRDRKKPQNTCFIVFRCNQRGADDP